MEWTDKRKSKSIDFASEILRTKAYKKTHRSFKDWCIDNGLKISRAACYRRLSGKLHRPSHHSVVYFISCKPVKSIKVGVTVNLNARLETIRTGCPLEIELVGTVSGSFDTEKEIHSKLAGWHIRGEWFHLNEFTKQVITEATDGRVRFDD